MTAHNNKALHPQQTLSAVTDFISYFATDDLIPSESIADLDSQEDEVVSFLCLLTSVDRLRFQRPRHFNLRKAPESYHEALARPDADVWQAAMRHDLTAWRNVTLLNEQLFLPIEKPLDFVGATHINLILMVL